mmetsp:Transcript_8882/g.20176  ORF Transcript_8882/g.20176 Transcript_8882/m.20176 type:complete len:157 (-) Transcript_8882:98-568(-)
MDGWTLFCLPKGASSSDFLETGVTVDETYTVDDVATKKTPCLLPSDGKTSCTTCKKSLRHISQTPLPPKKTTSTPLHIFSMGPVHARGEERNARMHMSKKEQNQSTHPSNKPPTMNPTTRKPTTNHQRYTRYVPRAPPSWRWAPLHPLLLHPPTWS